MTRTKVVPAVLLVAALVACRQVSNTNGRPSPNIRGSEIRLVRYERSDVEAAPIVSPSKPPDLVMDNCRGFRLFNSASSSYDAERGILTLDWTEGTRNRSLTIYTKSKSCSSSPDIQRELSGFSTRSK